MLQSSCRLVKPRWRGGRAGEESSGGSNDSNINSDGTLFDCDTETPINSPLVEGGAGEEGSGGSNDSNINGNGTLFDCDTEATINSPLVEGGAGEEGSKGSNDSNINGDGTLFDCDTETPINYPLATVMDKATGSDGKVETPSFAGEIQRINIGAGEGQGTIRFAFVNNRMEILTSPLATISPPATIQLRRQDAVLTLPSAASPKSGKNPPDLAGPVPQKLQHKNVRQDCESSNTSPPKLTAALTQTPPLRISWPVNATGRTHPSNFAGAPVREENYSISQATDTLRALSANLRKQAQTSQIELAEWGDHLGVVPIQEELDELESERLLRMQKRSDLMSMGEVLGVVITQMQLDQEESERLFRMGFVKQEARSCEAHSLTVATGQSVR